MTKILVTGSIKGQFESFFSKISKIINSSQKNKFDFLFAVGNFFGRNHKNLLTYISSHKIPIKTYFIIDGSEEDLTLIKDQPDGVQICENLFFLGKSGYTVIEGLKVAYISGTFDKENYTKNQSFELENYSQNDTEFPPKTDDIDILLSSEWPNGIQKLTSDEALAKKVESFGENPIWKLSKDLGPSYHFASKENLYHQSPLFLNNSHKRFSRFVGLGEQANAEKVKSLFAFVYNGFKTDIYLCPERVLKSPFSSVEAAPKNEQTRPEGGLYQRWNFDAAPEENDTSNEKRERETIPGRDYLCKICRVAGHFIYDCPRSENKKLFKRGSEKKECWFCIESKMFEKHLLVAMGEKSYLSLAKGAISQFHLLISPISHCERTSDEKEAVDEIKHFKKSLIKAAEKEGKEVLFWERVFVQMKNNHAFIECLFIEKSEWNKIFDLFRRKIKDMFFELSVFESGKYMGKETVNYKSHVYIEKGGGPTFLATIPNECKVNVNFVRELICDALELSAEYREWRRCVEPKDVEEKMCAHFRNLFDKVL